MSARLVVLPGDTTPVTSTQALAEVVHLLDQRMPLVAYRDKLAEDLRDLHEILACRLPKSVA